MMTVMNDELIRFACPACGKRLKSPPEHQGKRARCRCGERVIVPGAEPLIAEVVDEPFSPRKSGGERWTNPISAPPVTNTIAPLPPAPAQDAPGTQSFTLEYKVLPDTPAQPKPLGRSFSR